MDSRFASLGMTTLTSTYPATSGSRFSMKAPMPSSASRAIMFSVITSRRIAVGVGEAHFGLAIERFLAELDRVGGFERDLLRQRDRRIALGAGGDDAVDEADILGRGR